AGDGVAADGRNRPRARRARAGSLLPARTARRGARADVGLRPAGRTSAQLDERRLHQAAPPRPRGGAPPATPDLGPQRGRRRAGGRVQRPDPAADRRAPLRARRALGAGRRSARPASADRQPRHVRRLPDRAGARPARGCEGRADRMSGVSVASAAAELGGGLVLAPILPGLVQHWKARLQGRRGPSPVQPYRELRRLWGKTSVDPTGSGAVYRWAPAVAAASVTAAVLLVPVAAR